MTVDEINTAITIADEIADPDIGNGDWTAFLTVHGSEGDAELPFDVDSLITDEEVEHLLGDEEEEEEQEDEEEQPL